MMYLKEQGYKKAKDLKIESANSLSSETFFQKIFGQKFYKDQWLFLLSFLRLTI